MSVSGQPKKLSEKARRRFRFGTNAIIVMIVVIAVAVLANVLLSRLNLSVDLTGESLYSITDTSRKILSGLDRDVKIYALFDRVKGESSSTVVPVIKYLDIYDTFPRVSVSYVDLDSNPAFLREVLGENNAASAKSGDYIVSSGAHTRIVSSSAMYSTAYNQYSGTTNIVGIDAEACLTGAIQYVVSDKVPRVLVSTGNGEASLNGYTHLALTVQNSNFDIKEADLSVADIPEDCAAVLFIGPTKDLTSVQLAKLKTWFNTTGGNVIALMDPTQAGTDMPVFNELFGLFSLGVNNDVVTETADYCLPGYPQWFSGSLEAAASGPNENIQSTLTMFIETRSVELLSNTNTYSDSVALSHSSIGATATRIDTGEASTGVKTLMASGRYQGGTEVSKLLLSGSSKTLSDAYYMNWDAGWSSLMVRTLFWMYDSTNEGDMIPAKRLNTDRLTVTETTANVIGVVAIGVIPVAIMAVGFVIWLKRRHL